MTNATNAGPGSGSGSDAGHPPAGSSVRIPWVVILVSLLAFPVAYLLSLTSAMDDSRLVLAAGVVFCGAMVPLTYPLVRSVPAGRDVYFYVFTVFAFTSLIDLLLALTIDGRTPVLLFYLREGEVYLSTPHGLWINVWDGTFHYACYLLLTAMMLRPAHSYACTRFRAVALVWAGSILNSMIVLFVGSAVGTHAHHIKPSYLLNIPYALFPTIFLVRVLQARPAPTATAPHAAKSKPTSAAVAPSIRKPMWHWLLDVPLLSLLCLCACVCVVRALVVVRSRLPLAAWYGREAEAHLLDSNAYPTLQMLNYAFYLLPFLCWAALHVWAGPADAQSASASAHDVAATACFRDWSLFAVGAVLQGTFSYVGAALHQGGAFQFKEWAAQSTQPDAWNCFVVVNALLLLTPILVCARMHMRSPSSAQQQQQARVKAQ